MQAHGNSPRRVKVTNRRGIYYRDTPAGRRYEITFLDSSGRRRWQTVAGGLREADTALDDVRGRMTRGERVERSRATVAQVSETWLASLTELRPRTIEKYDTAMRVHVLPRLGRRRLADVNEDDVARLVAEMRAAGYAGWTIRGVLVPLSRLLSFAARRGMIGSNPVSRLERGERPRVERREQRILAREDIGALLDAALPTYRPLLATGVFTGLRLGELLGLTWADVDFEAGVVRVRKALDRTGARVAPKTPQAVRDVVLMPALADLLREQLRAVRRRPLAQLDRDRDFVFPSASGTPLGWRNVERRGLDRAAARAGLNMPGAPKLRMHDLRHTFASLLIAQGANVVFVSRQLGHASPDITLRVYAHLFDRVEHAQRTSALLETGFGAILRP